MSDFAPGDLVVCVDALGAPELTVGRAYTVTDVEIAPKGFSDEGELGVAVAEADPAPFSVYAAERFRKIDKADEGFSAWMHTLRPKEETREPGIAPAIVDTRLCLRRNEDCGSARRAGGAVTDATAAGNRPTLPLLPPISTHPVTPTFTLYTNPDLVKAIWEGSVE